MNTFYVTTDEDHVDFIVSAESEVEAGNYIEELKNEITIIDISKINSCEKGIVKRIEK